MTFVACFVPLYYPKKLKRFVVRENTFALTIMRNKKVWTSKWSHVDHVAYVTLLNSAMHGRNKFLIQEKSNSPIFIKKAFCTSINKVTRLDQSNVTHSSNYINNEINGNHINHKNNSDYLSMRILIIITVSALRDIRKQQLPT